MKTREEIIKKVNTLLNEDVTDQFNKKEMSSEFGEIIVKNSKGEFVDLQAVLYEHNIYYMVINYMFLLVKK